MTFTFRPAIQFTERAGLFVSLTGGTNSGKTFSALRLARGIAGPKGKIAVLDTEGGRTLHLKEDFKFDVSLMDPPFRPDRFADAAIAAEAAGYDVLVIDSFSMEWAGLGGVLDWQATEHKAMGGKESQKGASWIKPKMAHKAMVYSFLQRRMPIIFSIRGEETFVPPNTKLFKSITNKQFPFEVTVSFRLESDRKGYIDLSDPKSYKMEGAHQAIFRHGDRISEEHGAALAEWAKGNLRTPLPAASSQAGNSASGPDDLPMGPDAAFPEDEPGMDPRVAAIIDDARIVASEGMGAYQDYFKGLGRETRQALVDSGQHEKLKSLAEKVGGRA